MKRYLGLLLFAFGYALLAACGGSVDQAEPPEPKVPPEKTITIFFQSPVGVPNIYLWSDAVAEPAGAWPGTVMQSAEQLGAGWYEYTIKEAQTSEGQSNLIFNWDEGRGQTSDLARSLVQGDSVYDLETLAWTAYVEPPEKILIVCGSTTMRVSKQNTQENICDTDQALVDELTELVIDAGRVPFGSGGFSRWSGTGQLYVDNPNAASTSFVPEVPASPVLTNGIVTLALQPIFDSADDFSGARADYLVQCATCHGVKGEGDAQGAFPLLGLVPRYDLESLTRKIADTMPPSAETSCSEACASNVAQMILADQIAAPIASCSAEEPSVVVTQARNLKALNEIEFNATITDLLVLPDAFTAASYGNKLTAGSNTYPTGRDLLIDNARLFNIEKAVDGVIDAIERSGGMYTLTEGCTEIACWLNDFGEKVFRRPLSTLEKQRYSSLFEVTNEATLLRALFLSPHFMYRSELGSLQDNGFYKLNNYELASALSYTFWGTMPDDIALAKARQSALQTPDQIRTEVNRLLDNEQKTEAGLRRFIGGWLFNSRYTFKLSEQTRSYEQDLREETFQFVLQAIKNNVPFSEILTADYTYANKAVAEFYGLPSVTSGTLWEKRFYKDGTGPAAVDRQGLLAHASFLSTRAAVGQNNVIQRGVYVRRNILCQDFGTPLGAGDELEGGKGHLPEHANREFVALHTANPVCASCHQFIDGIGLGLDSYGSESQWREFERVFYTDASGGQAFKDVLTDSAGSIKALVSTLPTVLDPNSRSAAFSGIKALSTLINSTNHASLCFARQFHRYAIGALEQDYVGVSSDASDSCVIQSFSEKLQSGEQGLRDMLVAYTQTLNFTHRAP